jgi:hypothetical protein
MSAMLLPLIMGNSKVWVTPEDLVKMSQLVQKLERGTETQKHMVIT